MKAQFGRTAPRRHMYLASVPSSKMQFLLAAKEPCIVIGKRKIHPGFCLS